MFGIAVVIVVTVVDGWCVDAVDDIAAVVCVICGYVDVVVDNAYMHLGVHVGVSVFVVCVVVVVVVVIVVVVVSIGMVVVLVVVVFVAMWLPVL